MIMRFSFVYHLIEHHKYGFDSMAIFDGKTVHNIFLNIDKCSCIASVYFYLFFYSANKIIFVYLLSVIIIAFQYI